MPVMPQGCINLGIAETPVHFGAVETIAVLGEDIIYLIAWAIVCYRLAGPSTTLVLVTAIVPTLFLFINRLLLGNKLAK